MYFDSGNYKDQSFQPELIFEKLRPWTSPVEEVDYAEPD